MNFEFYIFADETLAKMKQSPERWSFFT